MRRRDLLLLSTPAVLVFIGRPEFSQAADQVYRVGVLAPEGMRAIEIFRERLAQLGWIEGRNIRFDYRSTGGDDTRQSALAAELVTLPVDLILTWGNSGDARGKAGDVDDPDRHGFDHKDLLQCINELRPIRGGVPASVLIHTHWRLALTSR